MIRVLSKIDEKSYKNIDIYNIGYMTIKKRFYPFSIKTSKCSCSCNNINDSYAKMCVANVIKNKSVRVFNLMSRANETRHIKLHGTCKYQCRLDASVCNNKQMSNGDKCRCECK